VGILVYQNRTSKINGLTSSGNDLWLTLEQLQEATGWELRPEGVCRDEVCVSIPIGREHEFLSDDNNRFNLVALAEMLGEAVVRDPGHGVWVFGETARKRERALLSLEAPDFTLPDLEGRLHSLSDYRGKKVFLYAWASW
jgi:AhpC/TSA family protein